MPFQDPRTHHPRTHQGITRNETNSYKKHRCGLFGIPTPPKTSPEAGSLITPQESRHTVAVCRSLGFTHLGYTNTVLIIVGSAVQRIYSCLKTLLQILKRYLGTQLPPDFNGRWAPDILEDLALRAFQELQNKVLLGTEIKSRYDLLKME